MLPRPNEEETDASPNAYPGVASGATDSGDAAPKTMPIAIIGMSCRLPGGATAPDKLWDLCVAGKSAWSEIPESRFNHDAWYHPDKEHIGTASFRTNDQEIC